MRLTVSTWNINSVRLRIDLVAKFIKAARPDVICLQETKCPDDRFPLKRFRRMLPETLWPRLRAAGLGKLLRPGKCLWVVSSARAI